MGAEWFTKFVRARDAGDFADRGNDQGANAGNRRCNYDGGVLDVAPADQLDITGGAEISDLSGLDDRCDHSPNPLLALERD